MEVSTDFDPAVHGFHFPNRFSGKDVVDELVDQRRLDELAGVELPDKFEDLVGRIRGADFWGTWGLCGGMAWGSLDNYLVDQKPPPLSKGPDRETALFKQLVKRQADSMQKGRVMTTCIKYQMLPEADSRLSRWIRLRESLGKITEEVSWPSIKRTIDNERPVPICLIRVRGLSNPDKHHQVLVTGYRMNDDTKLSLTIYDPNHPDKRPEISARLGDRKHNLQLGQTTGERLHGFFTTDYATE
jgi:hypothetical protein